MNIVVLGGRLTRDPEVRSTAGDNPTSVARFSLAVDRRGRSADGEQSADFISCTAFGKQAEFIEKYIKKGTKVIINGRIQTGSYTNREGQKVYTTDVIVENIEFGESKAQADPQREAPREAPGREAPKRREEPRYDDFMSIPDDVEDEGLPFN